MRELSIDPSDQYHASPLENDMFEWHFTIRGAPDTDFAGGIYHGRILLPSDYPFKPPNIVFLTPSGRFETGVKVCLSFSAHHPELWQPAWGIRLILEALISFLPTPADGAIGALDWTSDERKKLALESVKYRCPVCCCCGGGGVVTCSELLPTIKKTDTSAASSKKTKFLEEVEKLKLLQFQNHAITAEEETKKNVVNDDEGDTTKVKNDVVVEGGGEEYDEMDRKSPPELRMVQQEEEEEESSIVDGTAGSRPPPTFVDEEDLSSEQIIDDSVQVKSSPIQIDNSPVTPSTSELAIPQRVVDNTRAQGGAGGGGGGASSGLIRLVLRKPMGIVFEPMTDPHNPSQQRGARICDLPRTGAAALSQKLELGDELLSINDTTMSRLTFDEIMDFIIEADKERVDLLFRRPNREAQVELREHLVEQPRANPRAIDAENNAQRERIVVDQLPFLGVAAARSDNVLNGLITFVSIIVIVLLRQSHMLVEELYSLGEESEKAVGVESLDELL